jgi:hypothetical protein
MLFIAWPILPSAYDGSRVEAAWAAGFECKGVPVTSFCGGIAEGAGFECEGVPVTADARWIFT